MKYGFLKVSDDTSHELEVVSEAANKDVESPLYLPLVRDLSPRA